MGDSAVDRKKASKINNKTILLELFRRHFEALATAWNNTSLDKNSVES